MLFSGTQLSRKQKPGFNTGSAFSVLWGPCAGLCLSLASMTTPTPSTVCPLCSDCPILAAGSPILHRTSPALTPYALCTPLLPQVPSPWVQARTVPSQTPSSSAKYKPPSPPCSLSPAGSVCASAWYPQAPPPEAQVKASETRVRNAAGRRKSRLGHSNGGPQGSCFFGRKDTRRGLVSDRNPGGREMLPLTPLAGTANWCPVRVGLVLLDFRFPRSDSRSGWCRDSMPVRLEPELLGFCFCFL